MVQLDPISGEVHFVDQSGKVSWVGKPLGCAASAVLPVVGAADAVVLLDPDAHMKEPFRNLVRISAGGAVIWRAELPGRTDDAYVAVRFDGIQLQANTWSGYLVTLDIDSGRVLEATFTK